ncbi:MAG: hypothetical protein V2A70_10190 [Candidatus Omnitrophota bacterium]
MRKTIVFTLCTAILLFPAALLFQDRALAQDVTDIFDDKALVEGYSAKLAKSSKELLLAMINDDDLNALKKTAAVIVFGQKFASQIVSKEKIIVERVFLRQLQRGNSVYFQIAIMRVLVVIDRFRYFDSMVPLLIQKMDHYDPYVNELAYQALEDINALGNQRPREARIILNTLRKIFFLKRKNIAKEDPADLRLRNKLQLLRWAIKVLGVEELKTLPAEVISLM